MKLVSLFILAFASLAGCATSSGFRKSESGEGYSMKDGLTKDQFQIKVNLASGNNSKYVGLYMLRAIGEECAVRGYSHFYYADVDDTTVDGYCFRSPARKSLGITFDTAETNNPATLKVLETTHKPSTSLQVGDIVTKANGKSIGSFAALKNEIFNVTKNNQKQISLEYLREGQLKATKETFVELDEGLKGTNFGPEDLEELRSRIP